jgi:MFS family permease
MKDPPPASAAAPVGHAAVEPPPIRGAWTAVALLLGINLFNYIDRQVMAAVAPEVQKEFGSSDALTGLTASAFLISYMVFAPLFGWLADRYSRWLLIAAGVIAWSLASGASGLATNIWLLLLARAAVGVGEAAYGPAAPAVLSDLFSEKRRGMIISWFYVAIPVGSALGYLMGGAVLKAGWSWHWAFFLTVPPGLLLGAWAFAMRDPPRGAADAGASGGDHRIGGWEEYRVILRTPSYLLNTAAMTALTAAIGGIGFWMPKYVEKTTEGTAYPISLADANSTFGPLLVVSGLVATLAGGWAGDALRGRVTGSYFFVSGIAMVLAFPLLLAVTFTPFPYAWGVIFLAVFCLFFNTGPSNAALANVTHPSMRAAAFALNIFIIHAFGDVPSPPLIGWVNDQTNEMHTGMRVVSVTVLAGGLLWLWGARYLDRDTELAPTRLNPPASASSGNRPTA